MTTGRKLAAIGLPGIIAMIAMSEMRRPREPAHTCAMTADEIRARDRDKNLRMNESRQVRRARERAEAKKK
jgi:hypothetical protein